MSSDWLKTLEAHAAVITGLRDHGPVLDDVANLLIAAFRSGNRLFLAGNGGSAADAQHIAAEFVGRFKRERRALPAIALTTDTSALTAISNDFDFERVFARQVEGLFNAGDVLWVLSTSGNSPNVVEAAAEARERGGRVIGFTGRGGGAVNMYCDYLLCVPHRDSDRIQEAHALAYHYVCERVEAAFTDERQP